MKASTNNTPITEAGFSVRTLTAIKRTFPDAVTLGEIKQGIMDEPKKADHLDRNAYSEIEAAIAEETQTPAETGTAFDYSLVDDDTADYLRKATAKIANSYADIGAVLAEAQERLANNKNGVFEKWYRFLGMKKSTVHDYIHIHKKRQELLISSEFRTISENALEVFDGLPKTLQIDIASPSAPAEAVNAVLSGDITTHKDFIALKKQLEEAKNKARLISENYDRLEKVNSAHFDDLSKEREKTKELENKIKSLAEDVENLTMDNERLENENGELTGENTDLEEERDRLLAENKELRERPVETVTISQPSHEVENMMDAMKKMQREYSVWSADIQDKHFKEIQELNINHRRETEELRREYEEKLRQSEKPAGTHMQGYFLPMDTGMYTKLCEHCKGTPFAEALHKAKFINA